MSIERVDVENLRNYVLLCTNTLGITDIEQKFAESKFDSIESFEKINNLYRIFNKFYVHIENKISMLELTNLFVKIQWELMSDNNIINIGEIIELLDKLDKANIADNGEIEILPISNYEIATRLIILCGSVGLWHIKIIDECLYVQIDPELIKQFTIMLDICSKNLILSEK